MRAWLKRLLNISFSSLMLISCSIQLLVCTTSHLCFSSHNIRKRLVFILCKNVKKPNLPLLSIKDPREYLPFLRDLRALPKFYQRHKIDDHLRRHSSALKNLHTAGPDYFNEALSYVEKHALYHDALYLWVDSLEEYKVSIIIVMVFAHH